MTLKERKELANKSYNELKVIEAKYEKLFNDVAAAYTLEADWKRACRLMNRMDIIKNDRAAIYKAIGEKIKNIKKVIDNRIEF